MGKFKSRIIDEEHDRASARSFNIRTQAVASGVDPKNNCKAYQVSDQMRCPRCAFLWDVNDVDPPWCKDEKTIKKEKSQAAAEKAISAIKTLF